MTHPIFINPDSKRCWVAIRHSVDGYDYIDELTLSYSLEQTKITTLSSNDKMPIWAKDNKLLGYVQVKISTVYDRIEHIA